MLSHVEFLIIVFLLLSVIRRQQTPWVFDMFLNRILGQLNKIETQARHVPLEEVQKEMSALISNTTALRDASTFFEKLFRLSQF